MSQHCNDSTEATEACYTALYKSENKVEHKNPDFKCQFDSL